MPNIFQSPFHASDNNVPTSSNDAEGPSSPPHNDDENEEEQEEQRPIRLTVKTEVYIQ
jgi:hypothetical protein